PGPARPVRTRRGALMAVGSVVAVLLLAAVFLLPVSPLSLLADETPKPPKTATTLLGPDDFTDPKSGWPAGVGGGYADGAWRQSTTGRFPTYWIWRAAYGGVGQHLLTTTRMRIAEGADDAEAGVLCFGNDRMGTAQTGDYELTVSRRGNARLRKTVRNTVSDLAGGKVKALGDRYHDVQAICSVTAKGTRLALWVDGAPAFDHTDTDTPWTGGRIGFVTHRENPSWPHTVAYFDDWTLARFTP
ncbi:hypothetical protein, partial [Actinocorallia lasiicapitis]